jgi:uncharacterized protein YeaO (DUF488 family)
MSNTEFLIKRVYDDTSRGDGYRVLVDRLWPRGVKKAAARLDDWRRDIAPSSSLRVWFGHDPERFAEFSTRYLKELSVNEAVDAFLAEVRGKRVTLLYGARDPVFNHAGVLRKYLTSKQRSARR